MFRPTFVCGLVAIVAVVTASAEEFPLTFRTIPAKDVIAFPGGYGVSGSLHLAKPAKVKNEPKAVSRHPLYAERSEEHTSELQSLRHLVCRLLLEKKKPTH